MRILLGFVGLSGGLSLALILHFKEAEAGRFVLIDFAVVVSVWALCSAVASAQHTATRALEKIERMEQDERDQAARVVNGYVFDLKRKSER